MAKWQRQVLRMQKNHGWRCKPGNKIFVADRGALRFDYPATWVVDFADGAVQFRDKPKPDDDVLLQASVMRLAAGIDWERIPLPEMIYALIKDDYRGTVPSSEMVHVRRPSHEYAWIESSFVDPIEHRDACSRTLIARAANIQPLVTMEFWPEDRSWVEPIWDEIVRTLRVGEYIKDPTRGF